MRLSDIDFSLPQELIAQNPVEPRDAARLLVYRRSDCSITHSTVRELPSFLPKDTILIANDSRVRKSRLLIERNGKSAELLLLEPVAPGQFECMVRSRGVTVGEKLTLPDGTHATVAAPHDEASFTTFIVDFHRSSEAVEQLAEQHGQTPLPPYITKSQAPDERYQTVYAHETGSAAAPTAGLHFTPKLIERITAAGHQWETVTLHVGMGTFQPLRHEEVSANNLHHERTFVTAETAQRITEAMQASKPILAIGTTSCRTLESHAHEGTLQPGSTDTDLFIFPGYTFKAVNALLTNFHLPKSSLLLLVATLVGADPTTGKPLMSEYEAIAELKRIYNSAITEQYRFFTFGDAMIVL
jgi:S-adenosylmethionine:tRNA ribosyltransferase-isomerase